MSHRGLYCYSHIWSCGQGWGMVSPERCIITAGGCGRWVVDRAGGGHRVQVVESQVESDIGIGTVAPSIPELTSVSFFLSLGGPRRTWGPWLTWHPWGPGRRSCWPSRTSGESSLIPHTLWAPECALGLHAETQLTWGWVTGPRVCPTKNKQQLFFLFLFFLTLWIFPAFFIFFTSRFFN